MCVFACVCVCSKMLNDRIRWNILGPGFWCVVYHQCADEGVCSQLSCCRASLSGSMVWATEHTSLSLRPPPLGFGSGWHWAGGGDTHPPTRTLACTHTHIHPAPTKMNKNWKTTCKARLIQEHLQYADVFFCTLCLLNCLWLRASVMKLYVLVERAASPFQLGPGPSLLSGFCKTFFLIHVLMNKWSPWTHFFHICVNCFKSILSCHKKSTIDLQGLAHWTAVCFVNGHFAPSSLLKNLYINAKIA